VISAVRVRAQALGERVPLRVRLVAALVVLGALALAAMGFAAGTALRTYLVQRADAQLMAFADQALQGDLPLPQKAPPRDAQLPTTFFVAVLNAHGSGPGRLDRPLHDERDAPRLPTLDSRAVARHDGRPFTVSSRGAGGHDWRVLAMPLSDGTSTVVVGLSLEDVETTVAWLNAINAIVGLVVLVLLGVAGYLVVRSSLRPLVEVEHTARAIAAGDLSRRVPAGDPRTEVGRLARALNGMLGQIESAFRAREASEVSARRSEERMRQFVADASHELRTPLTSIRGYTELVLMSEAVSPSGRSALERVDSESKRMSSLVEDLLLLARLDEGQRGEASDVDLTELVIETTSDAQVAAPGYTWSLDLPDEPVEVRAVEAELRQVLINLLSNAHKHTPPGTVISTALAVGEGRASITVTDSGPGIDPAFLDTIFTRFSRGDAARSASAGSTGLGLAIVQALVEANGGSISVTSEPGRTQFRVDLPVSQPAHMPDQEHV
jgi:two-component system OmpR family sensor kinase